MADNLDGRKLILLGIGILFLLGLAIAMAHALLPIFLLGTAGSIILLIAFNQSNNSDYNETLLVIFGICIIGFLVCLAIVLFIEPSMAGKAGTQVFSTVLDTNSYLYLK